MTWQGDVAWMAENWARVVVAASTTATTGVAVQFYRTWRKGRSEDLKTETDGESVLRTHFTAELASIRTQLTASGAAHAERAAAAETRYRTGLRAADERFDVAMKAADEREARCQAELHQVRDEVRALTDELRGMRGQLMHTSRAAIVLATHAPSIPVQEAAERAADALDQAEVENDKSR